MVIDLVDEAGANWRLTFTNLQAVKVTTEECAARILEKLPESGVAFVADESEWMDMLGKGDSHFMERSKHFFVTCYDEIIEVVAWNLDVKAHDASQSTASLKPS